MKIRHIFTRVVLFFIGIIDLFIPKNRYLVVFSSTGGMKWADNSKYLFKYMVRHSNLNCIWATRSKKVMDKVKNENPEYKVIYLHNITGVLSALRAKTWICDHGTSDIFTLPFKDKRRKIYLLWHGIGPKVEPARMLTKRNKRRIARRMISSFDCLLTTSYNAAEYNFIPLGFPQDRIYDYGYPRDDYLVSSVSNSHKIKEDIFKILKYNSPDSKIILYAPTYREMYDEKNEEKEREFLSNVEKFLEETDSILLWREHINAKSSIKIYRSKRIFDFGQDIAEDINEYLAGIDILITDYSSIAYDFVLLDRPIIFYMYDFEDYNGYRGIAFKIPDDFPGSIVYEIKDLLMELKKSINNPDYGKDKRQAIVKKFHKYTDGLACNRIYKDLLLRNQTTFSKVHRKEK